MVTLEGQGAHCWERGVLKACIGNLGKHVLAEQWGQ